MSGEDIKELFQKYSPQIKLTKSTSDDKKGRGKWNFARIGRFQFGGTLKNGMLTLVLVEPVLWTFYTKHGNGLIKNSFRSSWPAKHCLSGCATVHLAVATESLRKAHDILLSWTSKVCCIPCRWNAVLVHANRVHSLQVPSMYHNKILRKLKSVDWGSVSSC